MAERACLPSVEPQELGASSWTAGADATGLDWLRATSPPRRTPTKGKTMAKIHGIDPDRNYRTTELAKIMNISDDYVRDFFNDKEGVIKLPRRKRITWIYPGDVVLRELERASVKFVPRPSPHGRNGR